MPYKDPEVRRQKQLEAQRKYRERHPERIKEQQKKYYDEHREERVANSTAWNKANPERAAEHQRKKYQRHREEYLEKLNTNRGANREEYNEYMSNWQTDKYRELREAAYKVLGEKCAMFHEDNDPFATDWQVLQIDHKNGGGSIERRSGWKKMFERILEHPEEYQILCSNHNWKKRYENGEGPGRPRKEVIVQTENSLITA